MCLSRLCKCCVTAQHHACSSARQATPDGAGLQQGIGTQFSCDLDPCDCCCCCMCIPAGRPPGATGLQHRKSARRERQKRWANMQPHWLSSCCRCSGARGLFSTIPCLLWHGVVATARQSTHDTSAAICQAVLSHRQVSGLWWRCLWLSPATGCVCCCCCCHVPRLLLVLRRHPRE